MGGSSSKKDPNAAAAAVERNRQLAKANTARQTVRYSETESNKVEEPGLVFTKYSDSGTFTILSGTLDRLVRALYDVRFYDDQFKSDFFFNYRVFVAPDQLIDRLAFHYRDSTTTTAEKQRIVSVLSTWLDLDYEVRHGDTVSTKILALLDIAIAEADDKALETALIDLARQAVRVDSSERDLTKAPNIESHEATKTMADTLMSLNVMGVAYSLITLYANQKARELERIMITEMTPRQIANELTLILHSYFMRVEPVECLHGAFSERPQDTPSMTAWCACAEHVKCWVITTILSERSIEARAELFSRFIQIGAECLTLNNFDGAFTIWCTLDSCPEVSIVRLKKTVALVKPEIMGLMTKMESILNPSAKVDGREDLNRFEFAAYHFARAQCQPPCVPSQYVLARNLFDKHIKHKDKLPNGYIDFNKLRDMGRILSDMRSYQLEPYVLPSISEVRDYILRCPVIVDRTIWQQMVDEIEPREVRTGRRQKRSASRGKSTKESSDDG